MPFNHDLVSGLDARRDFAKKLSILELLRVGGSIDVPALQSCKCFKNTCSPLFHKHLGILELLRVGGPGIE